LSPLFQRLPSSPTVAFRRLRVHDDSEPRERAAGHRAMAESL
jgi:hypothetical protein